MANAPTATKSTSINIENLHINITSHFNNTTSLDDAFYQIASKKFKNFLENTHTDGSECGIIYTSASDYVTV
jgi:hypothetical protein